MTQEHKMMLMKNSSELKWCANPEDVVAILYSHCKISREDKEDVLAEAANYRKSRKLLDIVVHSDDSVYDALIDALEETGQSNLANLLRCDQHPTTKTTRAPSHPVQATTSPGNISLWIPNIELHQYVGLQYYLCVRESLYHRILQWDIHCFYLEWSISI